MTKLVIETGFPEGQTAALRGKDSQQQLLVTGHFSSGQARDLTRDVTYEATPPGIVALDSTGLVLPITDGQVTVTATGPGGTKASMNLLVDQYDQRSADQFPESDRAGVHQVRLQQRRLPRQGQRPERLQAFAARLRAGRRLRAPGERRSRAAPVSRRSRAQPAAAQSRSTPCRTAAGSGMDADSHEYQLLRPLDSSGHALRQPDRSRRWRGSRCHPAERSMHRDSSQQILSSGPLQRRLDRRRHPRWPLTTRTMPRWPRPAQRAWSRRRADRRCGDHGPLSRAGGVFRASIAVGHRRSTSLPAGEELHRRRWYSRS